MKKLYFFVLIMFLFLVSAPSYAETQDVMAIINKTKKALDERPPISRKITIIVKEGEKITGQMVTGSAQKRFPNGRRSLIVLLEPQSLNGLAYLLNTMDNGSTEQWAYLPYIDRVRKIEEVSSYESFLSTDFTLADLSFSYINANDTYKYLGEDDIGGIKAYKIESVPKKKNYFYSRIVNWVSKDTSMLLRREFYSPNNSLWKRELFENITNINGVLVPLKIRMVDLEHKTSTELIINEVDAHTELPDEIFVPEQLKYSLKCPVWQKVCYLPEKQKK